MGSGADIGSEKGLVVKGGGEGWGWGAKVVAGMHDRWPRMLKHTFSF